VSVRKTIAKTAKEPDRGTQWLDSDGDHWKFGDDGWVVFLSDSGIYSIPYGWREVKRDFCDSFPWTEVTPQAPKPLGARIEVTSAKDLTNSLQAIAVNDFQVKDSGSREELGNGFVRDTEDGKADFARVLRINGLDLLPAEFLERWGAHMVKGAEKYGPDNWRQAEGEYAMERFARSATRHLRQLIRGDRDEDHAAAVAFNVAAMEYVRANLKEDNSGTDQ
jgi:hypothetical protein